MARPATPATSPSSSVVARTLHGGVALAALALLLLEFWLRPVSSPLLILLVVLYAGLLLWRPQAFLFVLPAVLPVASLAQWTGSLFMEEWDLLVLTTATLGYARLAFVANANARAPRHLLSLLLIGLLALSYSVSAVRGLLPLPAFDPLQLSGYHTHWNSLRILKGFAAALLLWPLLRRHLHQGGEHTYRLLAYGLIAALALLGLLALWERAAFPGLLNMSSDYRITALFWEMHVGGAALDGFLALTLPFALWWLLRPGTAIKTGAALALFAVASYACMVTFSRGVYAAYGATLLLLCINISSARPAQKADPSRRPGWQRLLIAAIICAPLVRVFLYSGYRGLLAAAGVVAASFFLAPAWRDMSRASLLRLVVLAIGLVAIGLALNAAFAKGAYFAYALGALGFAAAFGLHTLRGEHGGGAMAGAAYVLMLIGALLVAQHWGGDKALLDMSIALVIAVLFTLLNRVTRRPLWRSDQPTLVIWAGLLVLASIAAVGAHSYYMNERFSTVDHDLGGREHHWRTSLRSLSTTTDWLLGKGLGSFPTAQFWNVPDDERPGAHKLVRDDGNIFMYMSSPKHVLGYGEIYRVGQEVHFDGKGPLWIEMDVRGNRKFSVVIELCQKHLLYNGACYYANAHVQAGAQWQSLRLPMKGAFARSAWYAPKLDFFSLGIENTGVALSVDNLRLLDSSGRNLLDNGDFSAGTAYWFFTSDRFHLPWHIKNLWLNFLFDQGWLGVIAFSLALGVAITRLGLGAARRHPLAPYLLASLCAFAIVGLFDSLVDVPRLAFLFFTLLFVSLSLPPSMERPNA